MKTPFFPSEMTFEAHQILDWLRLAGVSEWVDDVPMRPLARPTAESVAGLPPIADPVATSSHPPSRTAPVPPSTDWAETLAALPDMAALQAWIMAFRELSLCRTATQAVTGGWLSAPADPTLPPVIMVIAEAPDATEDQNGQIFAGPAHDLLRQALRHLPVPRERIYMTYLSPWRPPGQRSLSPPEMALAQALLARTLALLPPTHVILLGDAVTRAMGQLTESLIPFPADPEAVPAAQPTRTGARSTAADKKFTIVFKGKNEKGHALSLQKPEIMLKELLTKKRIWASLLSFCRMLSTS